MMKKFSYRLLALFISLVVIFSGFSINAFANETITPEDNLIVAEENSSGFDGSYVSDPDDTADNSVDQYEDLSADPAAGNGIDRASSEAAPGSEVGESGDIAPGHEGGESGGTTPGSEGGESGEATPGDEGGEGGESGEAISGGGVDEGRESVDTITADEIEETTEETDDEEDPDAELDLAAIPGINSKVSAANALAILKEYDSDGYYIVNYMIQQGDSIGTWLSGSSSNAGGLDTVVHEEYHSYSFNKSGGWQEAIYIGGKKDISVAIYGQDVDIFPTSTWAETLSSSLRTFRFSTYVSSSSSTSANVRGPYGLLNEFTAYCWGMHDQLALFPYYKSQGNNMSVWSQFVNNCGNDRQAYAEFRFWILGYLDYAKTNNKAVYNYIINDRNFCDAYMTIKNKFESQIKEFNNRCSEIVSLAAADGISASFDGDTFWFGYQGTSTNYSDYSLLMNEMSKTKYQTVEAAIYSGSTEGSSQFKKVNGKWGWYQDGTLQTSMTGVVKGTINGKTAWYYIVNGIFTSATGLTKRADGSNKVWYYVKNGVFTKSSGIAQRADGSSKTWYYISNGVVTKATGIAKKADGSSNKWYYVSSGVFTKSSGIAQRADGSNNKWYYVSDGVFKKATGLARKADGSNKKWYYVKDGVYTKITTIAKRADGTGSNSYYVYNGSLYKYTGTVTIGSRKYKIVDGVVQ